MKNNSLLVTGSSGFSGSSIVDYFIRLNYKVQTFYNRKKNLKKNILKKKVNLIKRLNFKLQSDWIIHTASYHKINEFKKKPADKYKKNILMTKNLLEFMEKNKIKNFIFFSTIDISTKFMPNIKKFYIKSKIKSEKILIEAYKKKIIERLYILRLPAIIGTNCNESFLLSTLLKMKKDTKIELWNANLKYNNFVHIIDICKLLKNILVKKVKNESKIIECVSSKPIKLYSIIKLMKKYLKSNSKITIHTKKQKKNLLIKGNMNFKFTSTKNSILKFLRENQITEI